MKAGKRVALAVLGVFLGLLLAFMAITAYAYFSKKEIYDGYFSGEVELLFDRLNEEGMAAYGANTGITVSSDAEWGSAEYPYVISNVRHLYNLAELQRLGYFYKKYISQNADGTYSNIPHFLVCTPDYRPVLIDGTNFKGITSIGTDQYPFIGSVRGVKNTAAPITINASKTCDTSAICNIKVSGNPANADVGLFGFVGYLGDESTVDEQTNTFSGQISTLSQLVLIDVQVTVRSSLWDEVLSFLADIAADAVNGHRFSFSELYGDNDNYNKVPHENHHIGILAGHASYAAIEYISVYYSADDVVAMDLSDQTEVDGVNANYLSATGILGFIYNINPTIVDGPDGQTITAGSGDSYSNLSYSQVGGGGTSSGTKAGYVLAVEMYQKYCYTKNEDNTLTQDTDGTIYLKDAVSADGKALCTEWIRDRILWGTEATGRYYFYDGVFTFALSDALDVIEPTWGDAGADEFSIGQNTDGAWGVNYTKGNKAMVAYVQKITDSATLNAAIADGKQVFIMKESDSDIFLMSLYTGSTAGQGDFEVKYSTPGVAQQFGDAEFINSLIESYNGGDLALPDGMAENGYTVATLSQALTDGTLRAINVGITGSAVTLDDLRNKYQITPAVTGGYSYYAGDKPVPVNSNGTLNEYYDYTTSEYEGYFYYTVTQILFWTRYSYYWQGTKKDTAVTTLAENSSTSPSDFFANTGRTWEGETVFTRNGTTYTGVVVNKSTGKFYDSGNSANANGTVLTKPSTTTVYYFYRDDVNANVYYHSTDPATPHTITAEDGTGTYSLSGDEIYSVDGKTGVLLDRYPTYTFSATAQDGSNNILRMVKADFSAYGAHYALWNGTDDNAKVVGNFAHTFVLLSQTPTSVTDSTAATIRFQTDASGNVTCYIQYGIDSVGLYVNADTANTVFNTATSNTMDGTKLCIYAVEGMQDINYGRVTFDPESGTESYTFRADETVLFATPTHTKDANGNISGTSTAYTVMSLEELGWNNGLGNVVSSADLQSKFRMIKGIDFGASINIFNGTLGTTGIVTAPVGSEGVKANIPQSCIAFRINKADSDNKIRVIVSVPVSEFYPGEDGYDLGDYTRYFNLWKMEAAGESNVQVFDATGENLLDRFAVPRSHPYQPGMTPSDPTSEYITASYGDSEYRCYLNGDRVLIACEFTLDTTVDGYGVGVFCLGMSGIDAGGNVVEDVPMEIVYFSADGVASAGRDGQSGSQIGTIDFVYDYNGKVITVEEYSETDKNGENYATYYPSYCLMHFDLSQPASGSTETTPIFVPVNNEQVCVRRYVIGEGDTPASDENHTITPSRSTIKAILGGDKHVKISQYSRYADNVIIE